MVIEHDATTIDEGSETEQEEPPSEHGPSEEPDYVYELSHMDAQVFITKRTSAKENSDEKSDQHQSDIEPTDDTEPTVEYQVSSKHLIMASGKFRSELTGPWAESTKGEDGLHHLTAEDWEPEVFTILLNILHLQNRQVPRSISLEKLAKLAVLVDYYRCWEAVEMWTDIWIAEVKVQAPVPVSYGRNLILWMLVAWVFELDEEFEKTTAVALRQCQTPLINNMELPIPEAVIGE
ncbi:hypothetical protein N0V83_008091 [Neocucurbitaria cava]|uniref:BTB domain-containing protein n=1 Tax=Neocucurbitaria cava TaxID=798079 RepID=A0A9W8Y2Z9_9PLEO|nr:hypothetical protein N0V83_008091 [Neocucurbitaria cava]